MNIENAKKLVSQLARLPDEKFTMSTWASHGECGTVACIAGWTSILNGGPDNASEILHFAERFLDLSMQEADILFLNWPRWPTWGQRSGVPSRADAIAELNRLIAEAESA